MLPSLNLHREFRPVSWYAPLLLPVLPFLQILFLTQGGWEPGGLSTGRAASLFLLLILGVVVFFALPRLMARMSPSSRKEVQLLLPAWLAMVLLTQVIIFLSDEPTIAMQVLVITAAVISAVSFGFEFQQRTVASLLAQPIDRAALHRSKMGVLGVFLLMHWFLFGLGCLAAGIEVQVSHALGLLIGLSAAWGTTTYWTLVTRSALPGLVFSIAVPSLVLVVLAFLNNAAQKMGIPGPGWDDAVLTSLLYVATPVYVIFGLICGARRWRRLEAIDAVGGEAQGIFIRGWRRSFVQGRTVQMPWLALLLKEVRLQTVSIGAGALLVSVLFAVQFTNASSDLREYLRLFVVLLSATVLLLAGGTAIAEERRLGTLDGHVLFPVSRAFQWWLKVLVAAALATAAVLAVRMSGLIPVSQGQGREMIQWMMWLVAAAFFVSCLLASSGASSSLRAVLVGAVLGTLCIAAGSFMVSVGPEFIRVGAEQAGEQAASQWPDLVSEASILDGNEVAALEARARPGWLSPTSAILTALIPAVLACLVGMYFSWRNFATPAAAGRRLSWQALLCVVLFVVPSLGLLGIGRYLAQRARAAEVMLLAVEQIEWEKSLPSPERELWSSFGVNHGSLDLAPRGIVVKVLFQARSGEPDPAADQGATDTGQADRFIPLPLSSTNRGILLRNAIIPLSIRQRLKEDAEQRGESVADIPPEPVPLPMSPTGGIGGFQMSPTLLRRYGLTANVPSIEAPPTSPELGTGAPTSAPAVAPTPFRMSPELMRRYGLRPPKNTNSPPQPPR